MLTQRYSDHENLLQGNFNDLSIDDTFQAFRPNAILAFNRTITQDGLMALCCVDSNEWPYTARHQPATISVTENNAIEEVEIR